MRDISQLTQHMAQKKAALRQVAQIAIADISEKVVIGTPVDTGLARSNWQASLSGPTSGTVNVTDPSGQYSLAKVQATLAALNDQDFYLVNNLDYIADLEYGYSKQAPRGMLLIAVIQWQRIAAAAIKSVQSQSQT